MTTLRMRRIHGRDHYFHVTRMLITTQNVEYSMVKTSMEKTNYLLKNTSLRMIQNNLSTKTTTIQSRFFIDRNKHRINVFQGLGKSESTLYDHAENLPREHNTDVQLFTDGFRRCTGERRTSSSSIFLVSRERRCRSEVTAQVGETTTIITDRIRFCNPS